MTNDDAKRAGRYLGELFLGHLLDDNAEEVEEVEEGEQ